MDDPAARVLILAPLGDDAASTRSLLERLHVPCAVCSDLEHLCTEVNAGAGTLLITEESLDDPGLVELKSILAGQPSWSSLPMILLTNAIAHARPRTLRMLGATSGVTFLERPVRLMTLVSTIRSALSARQHQYELRDLINKLAENLRQRDEFLAMLNHELRNPLAAVQYATEILQHIAATDPLLARARDILERQVSHVTTLLDELLQVERITNGDIRLDRRLLDLRVVVEEALASVDLALRRRHHALELTLPDAPVYVLGDSLRLAQILSEVLENGVRYTPVGGEIRVTLRAGESAELVVTDSGVGMEADILAHVFDLFAQGHRGLDRSEGGLGVGLTLASRLTHMHGGTLEACSAGAGTGTTITLKIPLARDFTVNGSALETRTHDSLLEKARNGADHVGVTEGVGVGK